MHLTVDHVQFRITDTGSGQVILLLHGFPDSAKLWKDQVYMHDMTGFNAVLLTYWLQNSFSPLPTYYTSLEQNRSPHASMPAVDTQLAWLQIPVLVQSGYRVLAPDLKGFGQSDKPQDLQLYTMPNLLKDVLGFLDQLQVRKVHCVVGHDWGAALAWQLAGRFPDRFERLAALSVGHNASMFSMGGNQQREKSWYMLFFKVHTYI